MKKRKSPVRKPIPMTRWGKDHWSTFAYVEMRIVDYAGVPNRRHLRVSPKRHPGLAHCPWEVDIPTRLNDGKVRNNHDDIDCIDDMIAAGLLEWKGTGINPIFKLTPLGKEVAGLLRKHKGDGGWFATFDPSGKAVSP